MTFLKDTLIVVFYITANSWCRTNPGKTYFTYLLIDTNQRFLSNLMRGNCPLLKNVLFPTHLAEQPEFWRQTILLSQRKQQKQPSCSAKSIFTQIRLKQRAAISTHSSFAIVNDPWKIILKWAIMILIHCCQVLKHRSSLKLSKKLKQI